METIYPLEKTNRESPVVSSNTANQTSEQQRLISAGYQVLNYLREKRPLRNAAQTQQPRTVLEIALQNALSKPVHPSGRRDEVLYQSTQKGLAVMKEDYHTAKAALQFKNEQYIAQRPFLSEEGKRHIRQEPEKGDFRVANGQKGYIVASRIEAIQKVLQDSSITTGRFHQEPPTHAAVQAKNKERIRESFAGNVSPKQVHTESASQQTHKDSIKQDILFSTRFKR